MSCLSNLAPLGLVNPSMLPLKLLAVLGGITLGVVATGWLVKLLAKMLAFQRVSPLLLRFCRVLGGLAVGFLVWSSVFNGGGFGLGGGGWGNSGQGGGTGTGTSDRTNASKEPSDQRPGTSEQTLRIRMRGGAEPEKDQRFYVIEGEGPRTWQDLEPILADRNKNSKLKVIEIIIGKGSVDEHNPAVETLKDWAKDHEVAVKIEVLS